MKAIKQNPGFGLLAGSALLLAGAIIWGVLGMQPVQAGSASPAPTAVQDKPGAALDIKVIMHRFGAT